MFSWKFSPKKQRSVLNVNNPFTLNSQTPTFLHGESLCCHFVDHNSREVTLTPPPRIHLIVCFLVLTETCLFVVQTATSAFDGVDEMCLHRSASCVLFVISAEQRQWQPEWRMSSGWHSPFSDIFTQQNVVWLPFVTQIQMWPANKGSSVLSNLKPKADFLNCCLLCSFVLNMSGFSQKAPQALSEH